MPENPDSPPHGGASRIWRRHVTDGVPSSGIWYPNKDQIIGWGTWVQNLLGGDLLAEYGIRNPELNTPPGNDLNNTPKNFDIFGNVESLANRPPDENYGGVFVLGRGSARVAQVYIGHPPNGKTRMFIRNEDSNGWQPWQRVWTSDEILDIGGTPQQARDALELGSAAQASLGVGVAGQVPTRGDADDRYLRIGQHLADLADKSAARDNLQLGDIATKSFGSGPNTVRTNTDLDIRYLQTAQRIDVSNLPTSGNLQIPVRNAILENPYNAPGGYGLLHRTNSGSVSPGETVAGSNLRWAGIRSNGISVSSQDIPSGTWEACGAFVTDNPERVTLWRRIQ